VHVVDKGAVDFQCRQRKALEVGQRRIAGRIDPIGAWAIREVAGELQRWSALGFGDVPIAVNVSALQFRREDVAYSLGSAVKQVHVRPKLLEVELTESGVMTDPAQAIDTLHRIHALGMTIAIDDFGTGYSSLAYLKRFPIEKLKIDASFVRDIATAPGPAACRGRCGEARRR
jgi:EAL domain-containing protein (putative c-di-GMP-specific phosphodiesterase class I)